MRPLLSILIYTNSWVALCVASLVYGISSHFHLRHMEIITLWSFTGTISAYQLHRLFRLKQLKHTVRSNRRLLWMQNSYPFQLGWFTVNFLGWAFCTLYIPFSETSTLLIGLNGIIVTLYALPLPIIGNGIRNLPFVKNVLISSSWTILILIPFAAMHKSIPWQIPTLVFISVFAQIIPFDSRDLPNDPKQLHTIPQLVGVQNAQYIGLLLLLLALALQTGLLGFHWLLPLIILCGAAGHLISFKVGYQLRQEFLWELPLGLMGIWFFLA